MMGGKVAIGVTVAFILVGVFEYRRNLKLHLFFVGIMKNG